uniref:Putative folate/biopterin transporter n=1 Tax=Toxoplasma gondii COUG TaxID=1074873 RepID=A0A2G8Y7J9_TOXGO|nr:putative folate/biopterin transporter [Toxoplasma gondii COUG]
MRGVGVRTAFAGYEDADAVALAGAVDETPLLPWSEAEYLKKLTFTQFVIYLVGFSEGLTHLAALAIYYLLKDDLGLSPPEVSAIFIAPAIPWVFKPFFAFLSDSVAILGYRRKPYMIVFSALEAVGFLMLGLSPASVGTAISSLFLISLSAAFCSAVAEALVVESTTGKTLDQSAENVSDFITAKAIGSLAVAYFSGYLLEKTSKGSIFVATATFPLFITIVSFFMKDVTTPPERNLKAQFRELSEFLKQSVIWGPALYIFVYMAGPDYDDALFFFFTNKLGFSPTFMGTLRFTYGVAALLGVLLYRFVFRQAGFRQTLFWTIIVAVPIYVSPVILVTGLNQKLGISNQAFVLSGGFLIEATAEIQLLPLLVLTASICPPGLEGSVYGMMMSIRNSGSMVSRGLSAFFTWAVGITATNFSHLTAYILLCGAWLLLPLFFLGFIPDNAEVEEVKQHHDKLYKEIKQQQSA